MSPVIMLTLNNLALTRKAVASVLAQDIPVELLVIDNGSTDGTVEWLHSAKGLSAVFPSPAFSVAAAWNFGLRHFFRGGADYVFVLNNDIQLRPDTYRHLVMDGGGFVTAVGTDDPEKIKPVTFIVTHTFQEGRPAYSKPMGAGYPLPDPLRKRNHPDFSAFVIRREVYEKVGPFNEAFLGGYCEDSDYHCRLHAAGITAYCLDLPFLHWGAQTVKSANPADQKRIQIQADKNRALFHQMYGFGVGSKEYYSYFSSSPPE